MQPDAKPSSHRDIQWRDGSPSPCSFRTVHRNNCSPILLVEVWPLSTFGLVGAATWRICIAASPKPSRLDLGNLKWPTRWTRFHTPIVLNIAHYFPTSKLSDPRVQSINSDEVSGCADIVWRSLLRDMRSGHVPGHWSIFHQAPPLLPIFSFVSCVGRATKRVIEVIAHRSN